MALGTFLRTAHKTGGRVVVTLRRPGKLAVYAIFPCMPSLLSAYSCCFSPAVSFRRNRSLMLLLLLLLRRLLRLSSKILLSSLLSSDMSF